LDLYAWNRLGKPVLMTITNGREVVVHGRLVLSTFNKEVDRKNVKNPNAFVFVFPGTGKEGHLADPKKGWYRILKRAGLKDLHLQD